MHICRVQSQVPFSGVCAHLRDEKMGQAHTIEKLRGFAYKPLNHTNRIIIKFYMIIRMITEKTTTRSMMMII